MQQIRNFAHDLFRKFGWDIQRTLSVDKEKATQRHETEVRKWMFARHYRPKTVLDIGANIGQFAVLIRQVLPGVRIISFEPIEECFRKLQANKLIAPPFEPIHSALGNESGFADIYRNEFSPSSSLLPMEDLHRIEAPETRLTKRENIRLQKLDDLRTSLSISLPLFVKIDVQGFEEQVILGGKNLLLNAEAIVLEISSYPLYKGAPTFDRIYELMKDIGFAYKGNVDQWRSRTDGKILQFDALFEKETTTTAS